MEIVSLLVALAMGLALCFVIAFLWATKNNQFDDLQTPAYRAILDDEHVPRKNKKKLELENINKKENEKGSNE